MKSKIRLFLLVLTVLTAVFTGCVSNTPTVGPISGYNPQQQFAPSPNRARVSVVAFEATRQWGSNRDLEEALSSELWQTGKFEVVERSQLERVMREQRLGMSGHIDDRTAAEVGRLLGLNFVVMGRVIEARQEFYTTNPSNSVVPSKWIPKEIRATNPQRRVRVMVRVNIKAVEATTGVVLFHETMERSNTESAEGIYDFSSLYTKTARDAMRGIVRKM